METQGITAQERQQLMPDLPVQRSDGDSRLYWRIVWDDFKKNRPAFAALWVLGFMAFLAVFAPLLANHRPYILIDEQGIRFPLFRFLGVWDWILLIGPVQLIGAIVLCRGAARRGFVARLIGFTIVLAPAAAGAVLAAIVGELGRAAGQSAMWWTAVVMTSSAGLLIIAHAVAALNTDRNDESAKHSAAGATARLFVGAMLLLTASGLVGTLGKPQLDTTDYSIGAQDHGVFALFAPVPHDHTKPQVYLRNQRPGGPYLRVVPWGGSSAAQDLGLTDSRRDGDLAVEAGGSLTMNTPLRALRHGQGVRNHDQLMADFTIVTRSVQRFSVSLYGAATIGDVLETIERTSGGAIHAGISHDGRRVELLDMTAKRSIHLLGTDDVGSDVAARLIHATRVALSIGFVSTGIAVLIGITFGAAMGYFGGWVDILGMRIIEIFMAIPRLFLLLTVIAFIPPQWNQYMLYAMMAVIGALSWMDPARFIRAEFMRLRDQEFVQSARACGLPVRSILFKHMLPNGVTPVLVDASFTVAAAIFIETGLSFLGLGIKPPGSSWGQMLSGAVDPASGVFHWWLAILPGIMIFLTVFALNLIGDALRDSIDPKLKFSRRT